jgi:hypothetical protein
MDFGMGDAAMFELVAVTKVTLNAARWTHLLLFLG